MNNIGKYTLIFLIQPKTNNDIESKILLLKRKNQPAKGTYTGVGGHIENGEDIKQSALREVFEETGIKLNDIKLIGYYDIIKSFIGYRLINNLSEKFDQGGAITTREGILGLYSLDIIDNLPMTKYTKNILNYIINYIKLEGTAL